MLVLSCGGRQTTASQGEGDTVRFKYATQLSIVRYDGYTVATLKNPWKEGMVLHQYVLVSKDQDDIPQIHGATIIRTPLSRSMIFSTVHCAMLMDFGYFFLIFALFAISKSSECKSICISLILLHRAIIFASALSAESALYL